MCGPFCLPVSLESKVIQGDCHQVLASLPSACADAAFVDPPYNIGFNYGDGSKADLLPKDEYLGRIASLIRLCVERLTSSGSLWFLCPERWADQIGSLLSEHLPRRNRIIWRETFGQYREDRFPSGHRHLFWHVKDAKETPFHTEEIGIVPRERHWVHIRIRAGLRRRPGGGLHVWSGIRCTST